MEESRMEGRKFFLHGLLALLTVAFIFPLPLLAESGPEEPLTLIVNTGTENPENPQERGVGLLIDHPRPEEVSVRVPALPSGLRLDSVRTESRFVEGEGRWTAIDYRFIITSESDVELGSFQVSIPGKQVISVPLVLRGNRKTKDVPTQPRIEWEDIPSSVLLGKPFDLILILENFSQNSRDALPEVLIETPENVLLQRIPLSEQEKSRNGIAHVRLTALQAPKMALPLAILRIGTTDLRTVAHTISVTGVMKAEKSSVSLQKKLTERDSTTASPKKLVGPLPPLPEVPIFMQSSVSALYAKVSGLWKQHNYVAALALLRATERDTLEGYTIRSLRRAAEIAVRSKAGKDELYAPATLLYSTAAILIVLAIIVLLRILLGVTKWRGRWLFLCIMLFLSGFALGTFRLAIQLDAMFMLGKGRSAVVLDCTAYRVPDTSSAKIASFSEGERLRLREQTDTWTYVEADDGRSGWIENSRYIHY